VVVVVQPTLLPQAEQLVVQVQPTKVTLVELVYTEMVLQATLTAAAVVVQVLLALLLETALSVQVVTA
jgi:hypothetical protein